MDLDQTHAADRQKAEQLENLRSEHTSAQGKLEQVGNKRYHDPLKGITLNGKVRLYFFIVAQIALSILFKWAWQLGQSGQK